MRISTDSILSPLSIESTTSAPLVTLPKTVCFPFRWGWGAWVIKNWLPLVSGPGVCHGQHLCLVGEGITPCLVLKAVAGAAPACAGGISRPGPLYFCRGVYSASYISETAASFGAAFSCAAIFSGALMVSINTKDIKAQAAARLKAILKGKADPIHPPRGAPKP